MKLKEKVKGFYEEHKVACNVAGAAGLVVIGSVIGWKCCCKAKMPDMITKVVISDDGRLKPVIVDAFETYRGKPVSCLGLYGYGPIKLEDTGKIAEIAKEAGLNMSQELTHIIGFGLPYEE